MKIRQLIIAIAGFLLLTILYAEAQHSDAEAACRDQAAQYTRGDP